MSTRSIQDIARALFDCAMMWEPDVRLLGNLTARELGELAAHVALEVDARRIAAWLREVHETGLPHDTPEVLAGAIEDGEWRPPPSNGTPTEGT